MGIENTSWTSADGCVAPISPVSLSLSNGQRLAKFINRTDNPVGRAALGRHQRGDVVLIRTNTVYRIPLSASEVSELAIVFDRRDTGQILLYLDGKAISNGTLPLVASPKIAGELWFNAREWDKDLDTGFRGSLHRLSIYADVVPPQELARIRKRSTPHFNNYKCNITELLTPVIAASGTLTISYPGSTSLPSLVPIILLIILLWLAALFARRAMVSKYVRSFSQHYQGKSYQLLPSPA